MAFVSAVGVSPLTTSALRTSSSTCSSFAGRSVTHARTTRRVSKVARRITPACSDGTAVFPQVFDGSKFRIGIVWTRWNSELVGPMVADVKDALVACKVPNESIVEMQVPGAFEVPMAARLMCATQKVDAVVTVGVLIKGETDHYEYIAGAVSNGLMDLQLTVNVPIVFGVLTCPDWAAAEARSTGDKAHAKAWGYTAVEMAVLRASQVGVAPGKKSVGF